MGLRRVLLGAAAVCLLVLVGCLGFDEQTVYLEYDKLHDRLVMVVNYDGVCAVSGILSAVDREKGEPDESDVANAREQLAKVLEKRTVAFGGNWPFAFDLSDWRQELSAPDAHAELPERARKDFLSFLDLVTVQNGGFYEDAAGRPCGAQVVVVERASEAVRLLNRAINGAIRFRPQPSESTDPDEKLMAGMWLLAARRHHTWIALAGDSLVVAIPLPEDFFQKLREQAGKELFKVKAEDMQQRLSAVRALVTNPLLIWHENGMLKVRCGMATKPSVLVALPRQGEYRPNLVEHIRDAYGFHLDENLARYLMDPHAPAETEAESAARTMAPRLTQAERVRVLVRQIKTSPSEDYWARLRAEERPAAERQKPAELSDEELLKFWEARLPESAADPSEEAGSEDEPPQTAP